MAKFDLADYVDVQTRINDFWKQYPDGAILTRLLSDPSDFDRVVIHAEVFKHRDDTRPSGSDIAAEERGKNGMANTTSWHENCATSAIGRALADIGMARSQKDRPSRQEMEKAERHTPQPQHQPKQEGPRSLASAAQRNLIIGKWKALGNVVMGEDGKEHHDADKLNEALAKKYDEPGLTVSLLSAKQAKEVIDGLIKAEERKQKEVAG